MHFQRKKINIKLYLIYFFAKSHNFMYSREEWFITITSNKMFFLALKSDNLVLHGDHASRNKTPVHHHYYYQGWDEKYCRKHSTFSLLYSCVIIADFGKYISHRKRRMKTLKLFLGRNEQRTLVFYHGNTFLHVLCIIHFLLALQMYFLIFQPENIFSALHMFYQPASLSTSELDAYCR